jgi:hypothetical protein
MKRYFTTEDQAEVSQVKVKAIKRGTITGRRGTFHFDPKGKDPLARARTVPVEIAVEAKGKGLVEYAGKGSDRTAGKTAGTQLIDAVTSRRTTSVEKDGEDLRTAEYFGSTGADTRDTTAFPRDPSKYARTGVQSEELTVEPEDVLLDLDDDDDSSGDADEDDDTSGDDDDDTGSEAEAFNPTGTISTDETLNQEGNAGGADGPPKDDDDAIDTTDHDGSQSEHGDNNQVDDKTIDATKVEDAAPLAPAPRARRTSRAAPSSAD